MDVHFSPDVSLGTLIALAALLGVFWRAHMANQRRFGKIEGDLEVLKQWFHSWVNRQMGRSPNMGRD